jgi:hypothetical protein
MPVCNVRCLWRHRTKEVARVTAVAVCRRALVLTLFACGRSELGAAADDVVTDATATDTASDVIADKDDGAPMCTAECPYPTVKEYGCPLALVFAPMLRWCELSGGRMAQSIELCDALSVIRIETAPSEGFDYYYRSDDLALINTWSGSTTTGCIFETLPVSPDCFPGGARFSGWKGICPNPSGDAGSSDAR